MEVANTHVTYHIDTSQIYADEDFNCRGKIYPHQVADLANSIHEHGLQIPVIVWPRDNLPDGYKFLLVAGYRRFFACTVLLHETSILATVRTDLTLETARVLNFTENLERTDLNILEEAKAIDIAFPKKTPLKTIGKLLNRSTAWVKARKLLLTLPEEAQQAAAQGLFYVEDIKLVCSTSNFHRARLVQQIIEARKEGRSIVRLPASRDRKVLYLKPKITDLQGLLVYLTHKGLTGLATKVLLYAMGKMTLEQMQVYVENLLKNRLTDKRVQFILEKKDGGYEKGTNVP